MVGRRSIVRPRVEEIDAHIGEVPGVARCHRHAAGSGYGCNLGIRQGDRVTGGTAICGDRRIRTSRIAVERQDATGESSRMRVPLSASMGQT